MLKDTRLSALTVNRLIYEIMVGWSDVDQGYVAQAVDLPDFSARAPTEQEAIDRLRELLLKR